MDKKDKANDSDSIKRQLQELDHKYGQKIEPPKVKVVSSEKLASDIVGKIETFVLKGHTSGLKPIFEYEVDSSILGGVLIIDGDKHYDGTLKSQLINIHKTLGV